MAPSEKNIQDDNFFNKDENSFNILNRRKTNTEMRNHNFKGNSPINQRMNAQISLKKIETKSLFKDSSMKTLLPQIPENELKLPGQKSFKFKKNEEMTKSSGGSPDKKTQPKIYVEIHKNMNNKGLSEKDAFSAISSKLKGENNRTTNEFNLFENSHNDGVFLNRQSLLEKNVVFLD